MAGDNFGGGRRIGSLKAAIDMFGQSSSTSSVVKDLHKLRRKLGIYSESRKAAESAKVEAETELSSAKKKAIELSLLIEEFSGKADSQGRHIEATRESKTQKERVLLSGRVSESEYVEAVTELEAVTLKLNKLKLDIALVLGEKTLAEKELKDLGLKTEVNLRSMEDLKKEIEMANEEQVLVEFARIEALKEYKEIEEEREIKREEFLVSLEERKKEIEEMMEEIEKSKEIENELSVTLSDIDMLQSQLKLVKDMERRVQRNDKLSRSRGSFEREKDNLSVLKEIAEEIEVKKKEMAAIRTEMFRLMTSMDGVRKEIIQAKEETVQVNKVVQKADFKVQRLNSKLLRAKSRLEAVSAVEKGAKSLAANLASSHEQLNCDKEAATEEKLNVEEEISVVKAEIQKTELRINEKELKLLSELNELETVKTMENVALAKLESLIEKTVETLAWNSRESSTITISRFEYEYLTGRAFPAREVADKKVEAAEAWVEALKASTKEFLLKAEALKRETEVTRSEEEREAFKMQRSLSTKKIMEREIQKHKQSPDVERFLSGKVMRKSKKMSGKFTPTQREKLKRYSSANQATPTYFVIKKRKKVPNLVKFFGRKRLLE